MSDEAQKPATETSERPPASEAPPASAVSADPACALCASPIPDGKGAIINGTLVCLACRAQVDREIAAERPEPGTMPRAIGAGLASALVAGVAWAAVAILTGMNIGYVAVGVGYLAGMGVVYAVGHKRAVSLQVVAASCAVAGLIFGKYLIFAHQIMGYVAEKYGAEEAAELHYLHPKLLSIFVQPGTLASMASPFDLLWIAFAIGAAWKLPAPTMIAGGSQG